MSWSSLHFALCLEYGALNRGGTDWLLNEWLCKILDLVKGNSNANFRLKISRLVLSIP